MWSWGETASLMMKLMWQHTSFRTSCSKYFCWKTLIHVRSPRSLCRIGINLGTLKISTVHLFLTILIFPMPKWRISGILTFLAILQTFLTTKCRGSAQYNAEIMWIIWGMGPLSVDGCLLRSWNILRFKIWEHEVLVKAIAAFWWSLLEACQI